MQIACKTILAWYGIPLLFNIYTLKKSDGKKQASEKERNHGRQMMLIIQDILAALQPKSPTAMQFFSFVHLNFRRR